MDDVSYLWEKTVKPALTKSEGNPAHADMAWVEKRLYAGFRQFMKGCMKNHGIKRFTHEELFQPFQEKFWQEVSSQTIPYQSHSELFKQFKQRCAWYWDVWLIEGIKQDNQLALEYLYYRLRSKRLGSFRRLINRSIKVKLEAEDLFMDTFLLFRDKIKSGGFSLLPDADVASYFYSLGHRLLIQHTRKAESSRTDSMTSEVVAGKEDDVKIDRLIADRAILSQIQLKVQELGDLCYQILAMYWFEDLAVRDIAEKLNTEQRTITIRKYKCLQKLKDSCAYLFQAFSQTA